MSRTWLVTAVLAFSLLAGLALLLWQPTSGIAPVAPASPDSTTTEPLAVQGTVIAAETRTDAPSLPPERITAVVAKTADVRPALLEVLVAQTLPPSLLQLPLPNVEVSFELDGETGALLARTNAAGIATFELAGADGRTGVARCALGAAVRAELVAGTRVRVTLSVEARVIVQGNVVDAGGRGVAGATLKLLLWPLHEDDVPAPAAVGRTAADGSFRLGLGAGGRFGARHAAYGPSPMFVVRTGPADQAPPIVTLQLALLPEGAGVAGTVRGAAGQPVAGAEIELRSESPPPPNAELRAAPQRVRTAADGTFVVTGLPPGPIVWGVRAAGHGRATGRLRAAANERTRLDVQLPRPCRLTGTVRTADGAAATGAVVVAGVPGSFTAAFATTDESGAYTLDDLAPGNTQASARPPRPSGGGAARAATANLTLSPGQPTEWNAMLPPRDAEPELRGVVVDAGGTPLIGWRVTARAGASPRALATTADDGSFALPVGTEPFADLRVFAPRRSLTHFADVLLRAVDTKSAPLRVVVPAKRFGRLQANVTTASRLTIPATATCWHNERREVVRFVATGDGSLQLNELPPGTLDVVFEHPGHASASRRDLVVTADATLDLGTIELGAGGTLCGNVIGPDGRAPEQVQLTIFGKDVRLQADYSAGAYRFAGVPVGDHVLQVQGQGLAAATFDVKIEANTEQRQDVELQAGVPRRFLVTAPRGTGAVSLGLRSTADPTVLWTATSAVVRNDAAARVEFIAWLAPGEYEALAWSGAEWRARTAVTFAAGNDGEVSLVLAQQAPR